MTSRLGSIRGSTPPTGRKRRKPSLAPVITRPTSSKWASSTTRLAFSVPQRRIPITFPKRSFFTSSIRGRSSSIAWLATASSLPEGPGQLQSACLNIHGNLPHSPLTMALKVWPRWAKFLKWSKEAQAGESRTTSPSSAIREAVSTA